MPRIYQRPDGRYTTQRQRDGRRYTLYGRTEQEVEAKLRALEAQLAAGDPPSRSARLDELAERWLALGAGRWKPATLAKNRAVYKRWLQPALGRVRLNRLTPSRIEVTLQAVPRLRQRRLAYSVLHAMLEAGRRWGWLSRNPSGVIEPPPYRPQPPRLPTADELKRMLTAAVGDAWYPWIAVAVATGLRPGEQAALTWRDVDWARRRLAVDKAVSWLAGGPVVVRPKTHHSARHLALPEFALDALRAQRAALAARGLATGPDGLVFPSRTGGYVQLNVIGRHCRRLLGVSPHQIRHLHASLLLGNGAAVAETSRRLGHANTYTTLVTYAHALQDDAKLAAVIERALLPASKLAN